MTIQSVRSESRDNEFTGNRGKDGSVVLTFVGDVMLGRGVSTALETLSPHDIWGDVLPLLCKSDGVIGNLESPITDHTQQWQKTWKPFLFRADPRTIDLLKLGNFRFVNLANNHMLDYEEAGLADTLKILDQAEIGYAGAGLDGRGALKPVVVTVGGLKLGFISLTDNKPVFAASHRNPGTNFIRIKNDHVTLGLIDRLVCELRDANVDLIVMSVHWGPNFRSKPPERLQEFAHNVIDLGVNIIHGHSAHVLHGVEIYREGLILYDTGNFLDDYRDTGMTSIATRLFRMDRSMMFFLEIKESRFSKLRMVPVSLRPAQVRLAQGTEFEVIRQLMLKRIQPFQTPMECSPEGLELQL